MAIITKCKMRVNEIPVSEDNETRFSELQEAEVEEIEDALATYDQAHMPCSVEGRVSIGIKEQAKLIAGLDGCMSAFRVFYLSLSLSRKTVRERDTEEP